MLESLQMNLVGAINFTDYERLLNQRTVNFELEELNNNLTRIATLQSNMVFTLISYATLISMFTATIVVESVNNSPIYCYHASI